MSVSPGKNVRELAKLWALLGLDGSMMDVVNVLGKIALITGSMQIGFYLYSIWYLAWRIFFRCSNCPFDLENVDDNSYEDSEEYQYLDEWIKWYTSRCLGIICRRF